MDIRTFEVAETGRLHLRDAANRLMYADGDLSKPVVIVLYSPGSREFANAQAALNNRSLEKLRTRGKIDRTAEQNIADSAQYLADCTQSFENIEYDGLAGAELFKAVYGNSKIGFVADQASAFLGDWANFTKASPAS